MEVVQELVTLLVNNLNTAVPLLSVILGLLVKNKIIKTFHRLIEIKTTRYTRWLDFQHQRYGFLSNLIVKKTWLESLLIILFNKQSYVSNNKGHRPIEMRYRFDDSLVATVPIKDWKEFDKVFQEARSMHSVYDIRRHENDVTYRGNRVFAKEDDFYDMLAKVTPTLGKYLRSTGLR